MEQHSSCSKRKLFWLLLLPLLMGTLCCGNLVRIGFSPKSRAPQTFPNTDIVFVSSGGLGFVNADGSNPVNVNLSVKMVGDQFSGYSGSGVRPVMKGDNLTLIVKVNALNYRYMQNLNPLALWRTGEYPVLCTQWGEQYMPVLTADQSHIFIRTAQGMALYTLDSCGTGNGPLKVYENIFGVPSPDLQYIAYTNDTTAISGDDRSIVVHNMSNKEERIVGSGDYPAWSRDSRWLAYTGKDGIYVVNVAKGGQPQRIILYPNPAGKMDPTYSDINDNVPPEASWSADGKWLVYHRWMMKGNGDDFPSYYSIFKVNIGSGEEIKIIEHGIYPSWRWPAETP